MPGRVQKFFTLVGLLKYGIVLSALPARWTRP
jgi:hypothetical protein